MRSLQARRAILFLAIVALQTVILCACLTVVLSVVLIPYAIWTADLERFALALGSGWLGFIVGGLLYILLDLLRGFRNGLDEQRAHKDQW